MEPEELWDFEKAGQELQCTKHGLCSAEEVQMAETLGSILETKGRQVWSVSPEATVYEAIAHMADRSAGALVVMEQGRLVGMISERDYARKVILQGRSSKDTRVAEIMSAPAVTIGPRATIDEAMRIMSDRRIRHLPVTEGDQVIGLISIGDLVRATIADQAATIEHLHTYIAGIGR